LVSREWHPLVLWRGELRVASGLGFGGFFVHQRNRRDAFEPEYWTGSVWLPLPVEAAGMDAPSEWLQAAPVDTVVVTYYHTDVLGSVRAVTDAAGATVARHDYAPFGESTSPLTGDPRRFTGKERDAETAFDYFDARYYRNVWGRFTSADPAFRMDTFRGDPQLWNRYAYARQNPLRFIDPHGLEVVADEGSWELIRSTVDSSLWKHLNWDRRTHKITLVGSEDEIKKIGDVIFQFLATLIKSSVIYNVRTTSTPQFRGDDGRMSEVTYEEAGVVYTNWFYKAGKEGEKAKYYLGASVSPGRSKNFEIMVWKEGVGHTPPGRMREAIAHELFVHAHLWETLRIDPGTPHTNAAVEDRLNLIKAMFGSGGR